MNITELYAKAYESNLPKDWAAYSKASREIKSDLPTIKIYKDSLDDEWQGISDLGRPLNAYANHWWGE